MAPRSILRAVRESRAASKSAKRRKRAHSKWTLPVPVFQMTPLEQRVLLSSTNTFFDYYWNGAAGENLGLGSGTTVHSGANTATYLSAPTITVPLNNLPQHDALAITVGVVIMHRADHVGVSATITGASNPLLNASFSNPWEDAS